MNKTQKQIWENIAEEWNEFKTSPAKHVIKFLDNKKGKILDLGCGSGRNIKKQKDIEFYGVDFSNEQLKFAEKKAKENGIKAIFFKTKASELPFKDNFFDSAIFVATLHCIESSEERKKTLFELGRVVKPNAEIMISVWDKNSMKLFKENKTKEGFVDWKQDDKTYKRYYYFYDKEELKQLLESAGFKIIKIESSENPVQYSKKNIIVYCKKIKN